MPYRVVSLISIYEQGDQALMQREQLEAKLHELELDGFNLLTPLPDHTDDVGNKLAPQLIFHKPADRQWGP